MTQKERAKALVEKFINEKIVVLVCDENDKKSICKNPLSHECCNKHHKRI